MVITITKTQVRNVFKAVIGTELSSREQTFISAYGEPQIDVGGSIPYTDSEEQSQTLTLPASLKYMRSDFPVDKSFDGNSDVEAAHKLAGWIAAVQTRLTTAKTTLMEKPAPVSPDVTVVEV